MSDINRYLENITSQHRAATRFMAWLSVLLDMVDGAYDLLSEIQTEFHILNANGKQLNMLGNYVGIPRELPGTYDGTYDSRMDDRTYRKMIQAKIVRNQWPGTQETIRDIWENAFRNDLKVNYHDNQDMTMTVTLTGNFSLLETELILRGYVVPKPVGVGMTVVMDTEVSVPANIYVGVLVTASESFATILSE